MDIAKGENKIMSNIKKIYIQMVVAAVADDDVVCNKFEIV